MVERMRGVVKFFNEQKQWGFIAPESNDGDVFVHVTALNGLKTMADGQRVTFEIEQTKRGRKADNVLLA